MRGWDANFAHLGRRSFRRLGTRNLQCLGLDLWEAWVADVGWLCVGKSRAERQCQCPTEMVEGQRCCQVKGPSNGEFDWPGQFGNYKSIATDALAGASHF